METSSKLALARIERGLTQAKVAEFVGVETVTVCRWEKGASQPFLRHIKKLEAIFSKTAFELGLTVEEPTSPSISIAHLKADNTFAKFFRRDIELRIQCIMYDWLHGKKPSGSSYALLQQRISQELEDYPMTTNDPKQNHEGVDTSKRRTLRHLALLPIHALGLDVALSATSAAPEDILTHCAAGITACYQLAKGNYEDMSLAYSVLSTYLPPLKETVEQSSLHRKEAARLVAQALRIKAVLSVHREGSKRALNYGKQAEIFSDVSKDVPLQLVTLQQLAWFYSCDKQNNQALETALRAKHLLETSGDSNISISPLIKSAVYGALAKYQAQNRRTEDALTTLNLAYETFPPENEEKATSSSEEYDGKSNFTDFNRSTLILRDGLTHYYLGRYDEAFNSLSQAINPETLAAKIPASSTRVQIEIINHQAIASLKSPKRDKELIINLWRAGINGALALRSEQRFNEALGAYDIMEALWPGDGDITELRDLTRHW